MATTAKDREAEYTHDDDDDGAVDVIEPSRLMGSDVADAVADSGEPVYCVCRRPDDHKLMIQCNRCDEWYHVACVNVTLDDLKRLRAYVCPPCRDKEESLKPVPSPVPRPVSGPVSGHRRKRVADGDTGRKKGRSGEDDGGAGPTVDRRATSLPARYDPGRDPVRAMVREGLFAALSPFWMLRDEKSAMARADTEATALRELCNKAEEALFDVAKEPRAVEVAPPSHPSRLEARYSEEDSRQAIATTLATTPTTTMCGSRYKAKYRSLQFNLKDAKNKQLRWKLFNDLITPQELVSMTPEQMANQELFQVIKTAREQAIKDALLPSDPPSGDAKRTLPVVGDGGLTGARDTVSLATTALRATTGEESLSLPHASNGSSANVVWRGRIIFPGVATFSASAALQSGTTSAARHSAAFWQDTLPVNLHVSGRIASTRAAEYLRELQRSKSRETYALDIRPLPDADSTQFDTLIDHFRSADRFGVIAHDPTMIKDFYLVPLLPGEEPPILVADKEAASRLRLLAVIVSPK